jgi:hypothetical protein
MREAWTPSIVPSGSYQNIYLVMDDLGWHCRVWREADAERTDLETIITDLLDGQYSNPIAVFGFSVMRALRRHDVRVFNSDRKEPLEKAEADAGPVKAQRASAILLYPEIEISCDSRLFGFIYRNRSFGLSVPCGEASSIGGDTLIRQRNETSARGLSG